MASLMKFFPVFRFKRILLKELPDDRACHKVKKKEVSSTFLLPEKR